MRAARRALAKKPWPSIEKVEAQIVGMNEERKRLNGPATQRV